MSLPKKDPPKRKKTIERNDIPKNYGISRLDEYTKNAIETYNKGYIIEAFVVLYSILEMELNIIWDTFVFSIVKTNPRPAVKPKNYLDLINLLYELEVISKSQHSVLNDFHLGRNKAVHNLASHMKREVGTKIMQGKFKQGLKAAKIIDEILLKTVKNQFPKSLL